MKLAIDIQQQSTWLGAYIRLINKYEERCLKCQQLESAAEQVAQEGWLWDNDKTKITLIAIKGIAKNLKSKFEIHNWGKFVGIHK